MGTFSQYAVAAAKEAFADAATAYWEKVPIRLAALKSMRDVYKRQVLALDTTSAKILRNHKNSRPVLQTLATIFT